jgi:hypothetical protein
MLIWGRDKSAARAFQSVYYYRDIWNLAKPDIGT